MAQSECQLTSLNLIRLNCSALRHLSIRQTRLDAASIGRMALPTGLTHLTLSRECVIVQSCRCAFVATQLAC